MELKFRIASIFFEETGVAEGSDAPRNRNLRIRMDCVTEGVACNQMDMHIYNESDWHLGTGLSEGDVITMGIS